MKAISLLQPWASAWMLGIKLNETRDWPIPRTAAGPVAVHASKAFKPAERAVFMTPIVFEAFASKGITSSDALPLGAILGVLELDGCHRTEDIVDALTPLERALGNYGPNRFAWHTNPATRLMLLEPIKCPGALGFWKVPPEIDARLAEVFAP